VAQLQRLLAQRKHVLLLGLKGAAKWALDGRNERVRRRIVTGLRLANIQLDECRAVAPATARYLEHGIP